MAKTLGNSVDLSWVKRAEFKNINPLMVIQGRYGQQKASNHKQKQSFDLTKSLQDRHMRKS